MTDSARTCGSSRRSACGSRGKWLHTPAHDLSLGLGTLLAFIVLSACSSAEPSADKPASDAKAQAGHKDDDSRRMASSEESNATADASAGAAMADHSAAAEARDVSRKPAGAAGSTTSPAAAGSAAAAGGGGSLAAAGGAGSTAAVGGMSGSPAAGSGGSTTAQAAFALIPVGLQKANDMELAFPPDAINTVSISPELMWSGVPSNAKSLALVFRDLSMSIVKWVVWDIPPTVTDLPKGISQDSAMLKEIPGAMQLGALGHQGYYGPCCTENHYEWVLWALDVEKLPVSAGQTTATIRDTLIPAHQVASTPPLLMRRVTP